MTVMAEFRIYSIFALMTFVFACDPRLDLLCSEGILNANYTGCASVIQQLKESWGVCEMRNCKDLDEVNMVKGMSESERQLVREELLLIL